MAERAFPEGASVVEEVVELARRDVMRSQTDFLGRMAQALCQYEGVFDEYPDGDLPDDVHAEAEENISALAGLALAQLAMLRAPDDPLSMLVAPAPPQQGAPASDVLEGARRAIALVETPDAPKSVIDPWDWLYWTAESRNRFDRLARAALATQRDELVEALRRAIAFRAFDANDPKSIRFEFATEEDRLAAANAADEAGL